MPESDAKSAYIFRSYVNSFRYLYEDAEHFLQLAQNPELNDTFESVQYSRTALLLFILSLEGLINRALDHFLPKHLHDFVLDREESFRLEDKWLLLPLLVSEKQEVQFEKGAYPWSHFTELISIRNEFVHPKHDRPAYYRPITPNHWKALPWKEIPKDSGIKETEVIYRQTRIPRDPRAIRPEHVVQVKKIVDDIIAELDKLLNGKVSKDNWLRSDQMALIYPEGAVLNDLASLRKPKTAG